MAYRKMKKNTKTVKQYKKERERRKKVVTLLEKGYRAKDIASELQVSRRTVQRDIKKISNYMRGVLNKKMQATRDELCATLTALPALELYEVLGELIYGKTRKKLDIMAKLLRKK